MLPDLRTILAAMALTAIFVTLVGTTLMPVPGDPYIRSAGFPRVGQPLVQQAQVENPEQQQLHMLGYARRADELNRLLTLSQLPAPMARELPGAALDTTDDGSLTYAKQGGDAIEGAAPSVALAPTRPASDSDGQNSDSPGTGTGNSTPIRAAGGQGEGGGGGKKAVGPGSGEGRNGERKPGWQRNLLQQQRPHGRDERARLERRQAHRNRAERARSRTLT